MLKVIDQGSDDTTNAVSIRKFFEKTAGVATTTRTAEATIIQTRHRIPETPLGPHQVLVYQVPIPEPLRFLASEAIIRTLGAADRREDASDRPARRTALLKPFLPPH